MIVHSGIRSWGDASVDVGMGRCRMVFREVRERLSTKIVALRAEKVGSGKTSK